YKPEDIIVVAGSFYLNRALNGETRHDVEKVVIHQNYKKKTYDNDIALIKLSNEIKFDKHKKPICLPSSNDEVPRLMAVSGWGSTEERGRQSNVLLTVNVRTIPMQKCRQLLKEAKLTDNMICAGEEGKDSCQGDSGGPLFSKSEEPAKLFGVFIDEHKKYAGIGCGRKDRAGVYTKITNYIDWIQSNMS
ncbi:vitamin K-dependent protein C-like protein, partial [Leptotrombidium deliense]